MITRETSSLLPPELRRLSRRLALLHPLSPAPPDVKPAAVLIPLVEGAEGYEVILTKRTDTVETHKGQIAFPGGMIDAADESPAHTALRETHEEIGVPPSMIQLVGVLDALVTPTDFVITPVVGYLPQRPEFRPNRDEVQEIFLVPLGFFTRPGEGRMETRTVRGEPREVWFYQWGEHLIWGATARMLRDLLEHMDAGGVPLTKSRTG
jgi:8-oxo-dGTP pyrophosphatase MutT (NUDIX family)